MIAVAEIIVSDLLNSWKGIARYLNRGLRTVQRWEAELGLPVRRPRGRRRGAVMAMRSEIDEWLRSRPLVKKHERDTGTFVVSEPVNGNGLLRGNERITQDFRKPALADLVLRSHSVRDELGRSIEEFQGSVDQLVVITQMLARTMSGGKMLLRKRERLLRAMKASRVSK